MSKQQAERAAIRERLVVFTQEDHTADILPVIDANHERIVAGNHEMSVPVQDVEQYITPEGRLYVLRAPDFYVNETKRLADLEMSTVIQQAVMYQRPGAAANRQNPILKFLPWVAAAAFLLMFMLKK